MASSACTLIFMLLAIYCLLTASMLPQRSHCAAEHPRCIQLDGGGPNPQAAHKACRSSREVCRGSLQLLAPLQPGSQTLLDPLRRCRRPSAHVCPRSRGHLSVGGHWELGTPAAQVAAAGCGSQAWCGSGWQWAPGPGWLDLHSKAWQPKVSNSLQPRESVGRAANAVALRLCRGGAVRKTEAACRGGECGKFTNAGIEVAIEPRTPKGSGESEWMPDE